MCTIQSERALRARWRQRVSGGGGRWWRRGPRDAATDSDRAYHSSAGAGRQAGLRRSSAESAATGEQVGWASALLQRLTRSDSSEGSTNQAQSSAAGIAANMGPTDQLSRASAAFSSQPEAPLHLQITPQRSRLQLPRASCAASLLICCPPLQLHGSRVAAVSEPPMPV